MAQVLLIMTGLYCQLTGILSATLYIVKSFHSHFTHCARVHTRTHTHTHIDAEWESFTAPPPTCPSETVTYNCTVNDTNRYNGGRLGTTYWQVGPDHDYRPCALPHVDSTIQKECGPSSAFAARPQSRVGSYYTSTLQVIATPSLNGTSVRCYVPDGQGRERTIGIGRLEVIGKCW